MLFAKKVRKGLNYYTLNIPLLPGGDDDAVIAALKNRVQQAVEKGLLEVYQKRLRTTALGWKFVNDIQQMFLP